MEMDGVGRGRGLWRNVKQRLGLKGIGFCGSSWSSLGLGASDMNLIREDADDDLLDLALEDQTVRLTVSGGIRPIPADTRSAPPCVDQLPEARASSGMNLATALAAERNVRPLGPTMGATTEGTPNFMPLKSLMGLFEETDGKDRMRRKTEKGGDGGGVDAVCCVCMERNKGAAFIPCGHTYCRICSRELWMNRGACPLCNRPITEVLDIF